MKKLLYLFAAVLTLSLGSCEINTTYDLQYVNGTFYADNLNTAYGDIIELDGAGRARITSNTGFVNFDNYRINSSTGEISFQYLGNARFVNMNANTFVFRIVQTVPNYNYTDHNGDGYDDWTGQLIHYSTEVYRDLYFRR